MSERHKGQSRAAGSAERDHQPRRRLPHEQQQERGDAERMAACPGEPGGSRMARIVDKFRCPRNILPGEIA
jgi:hypothetical protein